MTYLCSAGHRTPAEATRQTGPVIHCPQAIGLRMECGRKAYRERPWTKHPFPPATEETPGSTG